MKNDALDEFEYHGWENIDLLKSSYPKKLHAEEMVWVF